MMTHLEEDTPALVRYAPAIFLAIATLSAGFAWGFWGGLFAFCIGTLLIYRDL